jgi:hypothetical protein
MDAAGTVFGAAVVLAVPVGIAVLGVVYAFKWRGRVLLQSVVLVGLFLYTLLLDLLVIHTLETDSSLDRWMIYVGPFVVYIPFVLAIAPFSMLRGSTIWRCTAAAVIAVGVTAVWQVTFLYVLRR